MNAAEDKGLRRLGEVGVRVVGEGLEEAGDSGVEIRERRRAGFRGDKGHEPLDEDSGDSSEECPTALIPPWWIVISPWHCKGR